MSQGKERPRTLDSAVERYKQGSCPSCGKRFGEPRGLEYRNKSLDLYCHTCRRCWPIELDIGALEDELSLLESPQSNTQFVSVAGLSTHREESTRSAVVGRLGDFFQRVVLRH